MAECACQIVRCCPNYENGVHYPDIEKLIALADFFHVSVDYLLGRSTTRLSTEVFNQTFCYKETIGSFVDKIKTLTEERKLALSLIVGDMEASARLQQTEKDEYGPTTLPFSNAIFSVRLSPLILKKPPLTP